MGFALAVPDTVGEALALLEGSSGAVALAGGTDLLRDVDDGRVAPTQVVSLRKLPWSAVTVTDRSITIGSTATLRTLERHPALRERFPGLWQAIRAVGGVALRGAATLGGNLARAAPASDLLPILLAYDATVHLVSRAGERDLTLDAFLRGNRETALGPGELIASTTLPFDGPSAYVWQRVRPANDISQLGVAVAYAGAPARWRVALGGVAPRPVRLTAAESALGEPAPTPTEIAAAGRAAVEEAPFLSDKRATEAYRRIVVQALLPRAVSAAVACRPGAGGP
jgi:CO/xanthine dehydrogenase FAD-binding subunit